MKSPITVTDIKRGDTVRVEFVDDNAYPSKAVEYTADTDMHGWGGSHHSYFLLDRRHVVPTAPTFGWLRIENAMPDLATWWLGDDYVHRLVDGHKKSIPAAAVVSFQCATAVPVSALDDLSAALERWKTDAEATLASDVATFLNATAAARGVDLR